MTMNRRPCLDVPHVFENLAKGLGGQKGLWAVETVVQGPWAPGTQIPWAAPRLGLLGAMGLTLAVAMRQVKMLVRLIGGRQIVVFEYRGTPTM